MRGRWRQRRETGEGEQVGWEVLGGGESGVRASPPLGTVGSTLGAYGNVFILNAFESRRK